MVQTKYKNLVLDDSNKLLNKNINVDVENNNKDIFLNNEGDKEVNKLEINQKKKNIFTFKQKDIITKGINNGVRSIIIKDFLSLKISLNSFFNIFNKLFIRIIS